MLVWLLDLCKEHVSAPVLLTIAVLLLSVWADWRMSRWILTQERVLLAAIQAAQTLAVTADTSLRDQQRFIEETIKRLDAENDRQRERLFHDIRRLEDAVFTVVPRHHGE